MKAAFYTFGCKVNQYETQSLMADFLKDGFELGTLDEDCDVYVVNSCTVTAEGDAKVRKLFRRLRREHPGALLALTGCYAQAFEEIAMLVPEADVITGARNRSALLPAVRQFIRQHERVVSVAPHQKGEAFEPMQVESFSGRTRAFLKIQDGCERYCAYCIIPKARGPFRSKPLEELRQELRVLAEHGYREVVLVGINLSTYGIDLGLRLRDAVEAACLTPGIERVRLSSLEPEMLEWEDLQAFSRFPAFCPQFHLSLQSGCDATLRRMNRHYTTAVYRRIVDDIRRVFENPAITTDIMVGFPGESEEEFSSSLRFCRELGLSKAHVFSYSRRPGTVADRMDGQIDPALKARRSREMIEAMRASRAEFLASQVGREVKVLVETCSDEGMGTGYSENYSPVHLRCSAKDCGSILRVRIVSAEEDFLCGALI